MAPVRVIPTYAGVVLACGTCRRVGKKQRRRRTSHAMGSPLPSPLRRTAASGTVVRARHVEPTARGSQLTRRALWQWSAPSRSTAACCTRGARSRRPCGAATSSACVTRATRLGPASRSSRWSSSSAPARPLDARAGAEANEARLHRHLHAGGLQCGAVLRAAPSARGELPRPRCAAPPATQQRAHPSST